MRMPVTWLCDVPLPGRQGRQEEDVVLSQAVSAVGEGLARSTPLPNCHNCCKDNSATAQRCGSEVPSLTMEKWQMSIGCWLPLCRYNRPMSLVYFWTQQTYGLCRASVQSLGAAGLLHNMRSCIGHWFNGVRYAAGGMWKREGGGWGKGTWSSRRAGKCETSMMTTWRQYWAFSPSSPNFLHSIASPPQFVAVCDKAGAFCRSNATTAGLSLAYTYSWVFVCAPRPMAAM